MSISTTSPLRSGLFRLSGYNGSSIPKKCSPLSLRFRVTCSAHLGSEYILILLLITVISSNAVKVFPSSLYFASEGYCSLIVSVSGVFDFTNTDSGFVKLNSTELIVIKLWSFLSTNKLLSLSRTVKSPEVHILLSPAGCIVQQGRKNKTKRMRNKVLIP